MWSQQQYQAVADEEGEEMKSGDWITRPRWRTINRVAAVIFVAVVFGALVTHVSQPSKDAPPEAPDSVQKVTLPVNFTKGLPFPAYKTEELLVQKPDPDASAHHERHCPVRPEWRSLQAQEKKDYISAITCMRELYSNVHPASGYTAYDDFPIIHARIGRLTNSSSSFLPWYRGFLHMYKRALTNRCDFRGQLPYWDWSLDFEALEKSPVFDPETGFGGDGDVNGFPTDVRNGRCVVDGPVANLLVPLSDTETDLHCLTRGFRDLDNTPGHMDGSGLSPQAVDEVLSADTFEDFNFKLNRIIIDFIPYGIAGDFETPTAAYDPIFFLHYAQLDRIWWLWQQKQPKMGIWSFGGSNSTDGIASLDDELVYEELGPDIEVRKVMDTRSKGMCYGY